VPQLDDSHDVQDAVDLPVPCAGEAVADLIAGGRVDRRGAVPRREVCFGGEPGDVTRFDQQPRGAGRADPVQAHQAGAGGLEQIPQFLVRGLLALVDAVNVADQLASHPPARFPGRILRPDLIQEGL
jgi:hypothetical protein